MPRPDLEVEQLRPSIECNAETALVQNFSPPWSVPAPVVLGPDPVPKSGLISKYIVEQARHGHEVLASVWCALGLDQIIKLGHIQPFFVLSSCENRRGV